MSYIDDTSEILSFLGSVTGDIPGVAAAINISNALMKEKYKVDEATKGIANSINSMIAESQNSTIEFQQSLDGEKGVADGLIENIKNLQSSWQTNSETQESMLTSIGRLNAMYPDLGLGISNVTGDLNLNIGAIKDSVASMQAVEELGAPFDQLLKKYQEANDLASADILLQEKMGESATKMSSILAEAMSNPLTAQAELQEISDGNNQAFNEEMANMLTLKDSYDAVAQQTDTVNQEISELTDQLNNNTVSQTANSDAINNNSGAMSTNMASGLALKDAEIANSQAIIDTGSKLTEERAEQLQSQIEAETIAKDASTANCDEWMSNIAALSDRGINEGLLKTLNDAGPEASELIGYLVRASDEELSQLGVVFDLYGTSAVDSLKAPLEEDTTVNAGSAMVDSMAQQILENPNLSLALITTVTNAKTSMLIQLASSNFIEIGDRIIKDIIIGLDGNKATLLATAAAIASSLKSTLSIHGRITATASGKTATVDVNWYKDGAIFNSPAIIGVGEAGSEAVLPISRLNGILARSMQKLGLDSTLEAILDKSDEFAGASLQSLTGGLYQSVANTSNTNTGNTNSFGPIVIQQPVKTPSETARAIKREMVMLLG